MSANRFLNSSTVPVQFHFPVCSLCSVSQPVVQYLCKIHSGTEYLRWYKIPGHLSPGSETRQNWEGSTLSMDRELHCAQTLCCPGEASTTYPMPYRGMGHYREANICLCNGLFGTGLSDLHQPRWCFGLCPDPLSSVCNTLMLAVIILCNTIVWCHERHQYLPQYRCLI